MSNQSRLDVTELERDRYARTARIRLADRQITTPHFFTLVKNPDEFQSILDLTAEKQPPSASGCVVRLFDAQRVLGEHLANMTQIRVDALSRYVEERFHTFLETKILVIDPATEYLFYEPCLPRWIDDLSLPAPIVGYARRCKTQKERLDSSEYSKWKEAHHTLFWNEMSEDAASRNRMIGEVFDLELRYRSTILLPPVPLVRSQRQMNVSIQINEVAHGISAGRSAEFASYFIIQQGMLDDEESVDELLKYLRNTQTRITVLKFKYLNLTNPGRISHLVAYRDFLQQLSFLKETNKDRVFIVLENGYQVFPSATVAFDIASTSMTGYDGDSQYGQGEYGAWFDPEQMVHVPFKDLKKICRNNHNRLPCAHDTCGNIDIATIDPDSWNRVRRKHYVLTMNDYMTMIAKAIKDKKIELAIDKLINSDISRLKKLIPRT
jgi:hypothetical protein